MAASRRRIDFRGLPALLAIAAVAAAGIWWMLRDEGDAARESDQSPVGAHSSTAQTGDDRSSDPFWPSGTEAEFSAMRTRREVPSVRVVLTPSSKSVLRIAIDGPYRVRTVDGDGERSERAEPVQENARELHVSQRLSETLVKPLADGFQIGARRFRATMLELVPDRSPAVWVNDHQYRGSVRLFRPRTGRLIAVNVLPLDDYLASVVDSEMPAAFPDAARRAQAIVARTYALYNVGRAESHPHFDLYATTRSQRYLGFQYRDRNNRRLAGESSDSRRIVRSTAGLVLTRGGELIPAYYSAVCGGRTTPGSEVFADADVIPSVPCNWCRESKLYRWTVRVDRSRASDRFQRYFASRGQSFGRLTTLTPADVPGGLPSLFEVGDGVRKYRVAAAAIRRDVFPADLHSPRFSVHLSGEALLFEGRGHGHGVGLCQWGARGLALSGRSARDILRHYYPGTSLVRLDPDRQNPPTVGAFPRRTADRD